MNDVELLRYCLRHFLHLDESNAAVHCAPVRYSPITFRLAESLEAKGCGGLNIVGIVLRDSGLYDEDTGR